jgi:hypothetical protein
MRVFASVLVGDTQPLARKPAPTKHDGYLDHRGMVLPLPNLLRCFRASDPEQEKLSLPPNRGKVIERVVRQADRLRWLLR